MRETLPKDYIKKVLAGMEGNKTHTAQILSISRIGLISKIKKYKLE
jgi:transcriptional regulator with PAS, ATPase and Fis domain